MLNHNKVYMQTQDIKTIKNKVLMEIRRLVFQYHNDYDNRDFHKHFWSANMIIYL